MGKEKYLKDVENLFRKSPVVSYSSIEKLVKGKKGAKQYAKQLTRNLILKGKIKRLAKGYYTEFDDPSLSVFCFKPAYLGLQDALSFHNVWEQETIPIIITTRKVRQGIRKILGYNVLVRKISKKYLFGFGYYKENGFYLPYSDVEKTIIDMIYFKEKLDSRLIREMKKKIDKRKLEAYLKSYPERSRKRIMKS